MGTGEFHLVSESVLREIDRKKERLEKLPTYHLDRSQKRQRILQQESAKHSVSLEFEGYTTSTAEETRKKAKEKKC